jgi:hypothetical protein
MMKILKLLFMIGIGCITSVIGIIFSIIVTYIFSILLIVVCDI